jgi:hypothetical protein
MATSWTTEKIIQLLLLVVDEKVQGPPNYERMGQFFGVSRDAVKQKYNNLKKDFHATVIQTAAIQTGNPTPPPTPSRKRKATMATNVLEVTNDVSSEEVVESDGNSGRVKRARVSRVAAGKAKQRIKEEYEEMENFVTFEDE